MYFCYFQALSLRGLVGQLQQTVRFNSSLKIQDIEVIQPERSFKVLFVEGRALFQSEKWCSIANIYHVTIFFFIIKINVFFFNYFSMRTCRFVLLHLSGFNPSRPLVLSRLENTSLITCSRYSTTRR